MNVVHSLAFVFLFAFPSTKSAHTFLACIAVHNMFSMRDGCNWILKRSSFYSLLKELTKTNQTITSHTNEGHIYATAHQ